MAQTAPATRPEARRARGRRRRRRSAATGGPAPTLRILETRVLRGPNYWAREPVIRMLVDLGVLEEFPSNKIPGFTDALVALLPDARGPRLLARPARRVHHPAPRTGRGWATSPSTSRSSSRTSPAPTSATARPARPGRTASTTASTSTARSRSGSRPGRMAVALVNHLVAPGRPRGLLRLRAGARAAHPPRRAAGVRPVDAGPHRRGGQPRHPVHPARPPLARPVRPRRPPAADPRDDDLADLGDRRRHRLGQEPDQPAARLGRPAGAALGGRRRPRRRRSPPRTGSASRASSSRSTATTAAASTSTCAREEAVRAAFHGALAAEPLAATSSSRRTSPATTTAASSSAARSRRSPSASRRRVTGDGEHTVRQLVDIANQDPRRGIGHEKVLTRIKLDEAAEELVRAQGFELDDGPARRHLDQARPDRQHVDRRDLDRPDHRGPPRQRRDRRDRGPDRRARRRRHRLHLPRHRDARPRDRRGDRRGQRGTRVPDAHPSDRGRAAVRRAAGHRLAVPVRVAGPHPDHRGDRHERQDDDGPDDRPHPQADGPAGRDDLDRRHRGRRPAHQEGRHVRAEVGPDGAPEPDRRHGRLRGRARRDPARGPRLRPQRRRRRDQRHRRPPRPRRHRLPSASSRTSRASSSRRCRARAPRSSTPTTRTSTGWAATAPAGSSCFSMSTTKGEDGFDRVDGHTGRGGAAFCLEASAEGELIVLKLGPRTMPVLYTHLIPATFGGRARMNVANALAAAAAAWASGAHLHDIRQGLRTFTTSFFQAPGPAQPDRRRRGPGRHRLLPQRRRHAPAGRLRRADDERARDQGGSPQDAGDGGPVRPRDRRPGHPGRPPRRGPAGVRRDRRDRLRRDHRPRGQEPARPGARRDRHERHRGRPRGEGRRHGPDDAVGEGARRDDRGPRPRSGGRTRAISSCAASTTRSASTARRWRRPAHRVAGRRSPTRANSKPRRASRLGLARSPALPLRRVHGAGDDRPHPRAVRHLGPAHRVRRPHRPRHRAVGERATSTSRRSCASACCARSTRARWAATRGPAGSCSRCSSSPSAASSSSAR